MKYGNCCSSAAAHLSLICFLLILVTSAGAQLRQTRRVLIINDLGVVSSPGFAEVDQAIFSVLQNSPYQIELYHESLQLIFFPDDASQRAFRESLILKYSERKPDLIIAVGSASLRFIAESHQPFIREAPVIFCAIVGEIPNKLKSDLHVTGVLAKLQPEETLKAALQLLPGTKRVVVVGGMGKFDEKWEEVAKLAFQKYESKLEFSYLTDLTMADLLERLRHLPNNTIVMHTSISEDAAAQRFIDSAQSVPLVAAAANAPVFVMDNVDLRAGTVGGVLVNWPDDGRVAGEMAVRVLNGERPGDIPIEMSKGAYMFDWRALKRWGLKESALPRGSILINRQPTVWESYKVYIIGGISLILLEALLIGALLRQRARTKRSEEYSRHLVLRSPVATVVTRGSMHKNELVNHKFTELFGYTIEEVPDEARWWPLAYPDEAYREEIKSEWRRRVESALNQRKQIEPMEARVRCKDGSYRHIEFHFASFADSNVVKFIDVTERKAAQDALADVGRRLIEAHEEERTRIGRELHDDINQRLALLAVELGGWSQDASTNEVTELVRQTEARITEIAHDVQGLSHRLHSSKLDYLGLATAAKSFCTELSDKTRVEIVFGHAGIPRTLSKEVSLCLFRVLQEALQNAVKHSGVRSFTVDLRGTEESIELTVSDIGQGFEEQKAFTHQGLGLISMRERLQLVNGELSVKSKPGAGTTIRARVPRRSETDCERAVG